MTNTSTAVLHGLVRQQRQRHRAWILGGTFLLPLVIFVGLTSGAVQIDLTSLLLGADIHSTAYIVLTEIRFPRVLMTIVTGAGLAMCGAVLQALLRNPLAEPGLIGVSAGAALFAAIGYWLLSVLSWSFITHPLFIPMMAFVGAFIAMLLLFIIAGNQLNREGTLILILAGVAINTACMTLLGVIIVSVDDGTLRQISFWSMGSYAGITNQIAGFSSLVILVASVLIWRLRNPLMLMAISEKHAKFQGIQTNRVRYTCLSLISLMVAVSVCFTGIVGFVGLIVPHICRMLVSSHLRILLPISALFGGILVTLADTVARTVIAPIELPVGLVTSLLGIPFFILLIIQQRRKLSHV